MLALPALIVTATRGLTTLLATANELATRFGFEAPAELRQLASRGGNSRLTIEARRLLTHNGEPGPQLAAAATGHIEGLLRSAGL